MTIMAPEAVGESLDSQGTRAMASRACFGRTRRIQLELPMLSSSHRVPPAQGEHSPVCAELAG